MSSITGNYNSAQPKTQIASQAQHSNPPSNNHFGGGGVETHASANNYAYAKSPKAAATTTTSKQTFFKMPGESKLDPKPKPLAGMGDLSGLKKFTVPTTSSSSKLTGPNIPTTGSKTGVITIYLKRLILILIAWRTV